MHVGRLNVTLWVCCWENSSTYSCDGIYLNYYFNKRSFHYAAIIKRLLLKLIVSLSTLILRISVLCNSIWWNFKVIERFGSSQKSNIFLFRSELMNVRTEHPIKMRITKWTQLNANEFIGKKSIYIYFCFIQLFLLKFAFWYKIVSSCLHSRLVFTEICLKFWICQLAQCCYHQELTKLLNVLKSFICSQHPS